MGPGHRDVIVFGGRGSVVRRQFFDTLFFTIFPPKGLQNGANMEAKGGPKSEMAEALKAWWGLYILHISPSERGP